MTIPRYDSTEMKQSKNIYENVYADSSHKFVSARLLLKWKGSVYKLMTFHWLMWLAAYVILSIIYRHGLCGHEERKYHKMMFEMICFYAQKFGGLLPISFLVGFYVSQVVSRWWQQFQSLPWPDQLAMKLANFVPGTDDIHHDLRKVIMRYVNLSNILVFRLVAPRVMKRFPTLDSLIEAKLMLPHEAEILKKIDDKTPHESTWLPLLWASRLLTKAFEEGKIKIESCLVIYNLQGSFLELESKNRKILNYGWMNFPLAYTQVVTFAVYFYFFAALFGRQYLIPDKSEWSIHANETNIAFVTKGPYQQHTPDFFVPMFTLVEFFCYVGWIKVAATLLNPFGDDDEDFQMNYLIDRNLQVSYLIVDQACKDLNTITDHFLETTQNIPVLEKVMANPDNTDDSIVGNVGRAMDHAFDNFTEGIAGNFRKVQNLNWTTSLGSPKQKQSTENNTTTIVLEPSSQVDDAGPPE